MESYYELSEEYWGRFVSKLTPGGLEECLQEVCSEHNGEYDEKEEVALRRLLPFTTKEVRDEALLSESTIPLAKDLIQAYEEAQKK